MRSMAARKAAYPRRPLPRRQSLDRRTGMWCLFPPRRSPGSAVLNPVQVCCRDRSLLYIFFTAPYAALLTELVIPRVLLSTQALQRQLSTRRRCQHLHFQCRRSIWHQTLMPHLFLPTHATSHSNSRQVGNPTPQFRTMRVELIGHFKICMTDIYLQNECAHVGLSVHAPVHIFEYGSSQKTQLS